VFLVGVYLCFGKTRLQGLRRGVNGKTSGGAMFFYAGTNQVAARDTVFTGV
jgi:hypothetical protein